ncbi:MAG: glycoside hydrolase family 99-like domain-containing protein [Azoarcus sp.]|jgi:hypothetical protein|nr:glycoside hydrolase family 99-like domain-containing protein [Azoarcus sp.]
MKSISATEREGAWFKVLFSILVLMASGAALGEVSIGVYYYPGWSAAMGLYKPDPWKVIKPYPDLEPLLGWYNDEKPKTLNQQLNWMADYGIDFVTFCWYWKEERPLQEISVRAYLKASARSRVRYSLLWANHFRSPASLAEWDKLHMRNTEYLRIDNKPVLFVFSGEFLKNQAKAIGMLPAEMLERAQRAAHKVGLDGIYFVLCTEASEFWVKDFARKSGFDAISAYNYYFDMSGDFHTATRPSHSFVELDANCRMQWDWILKNSSLSYFVPMISGWNKRLWGGSKDALHDNSISTPQEFEMHLRSGYDVIIRNIAKTKGIGMLCCWNEYEEGSVIEPTKRYGFEYLQRIQKVFEK